MPSAAARCRRPRTMRVFKSRASRRSAPKARTPASPGLLRAGQHGVDLVEPSFLVSVEAMRVDPLRDLDRGPDPFGVWVPRIGPPGMTWGFSIGLQTPPERGRIRIHGFATGL